MYDDDNEGDDDGGDYIILFTTTSTCLILNLRFPHVGNHWEWKECISKYFIV